jgi:hypothetical protein
MRCDPPDAVGGEQGGNPLVEVIHLHDWPAINVLPYSEISQRFEGALNFIESCPEKLSKGVCLTDEKQFRESRRSALRSEEPMPGISSPLPTKCCDDAFQQRIPMEPTPS